MASKTMMAFFLIALSTLLTLSNQIKIEEMVDNQEAFDALVTDEEQLVAMELIDAEDDEN